jgi:hypothetical protein
MLAYAQTDEARRFITQLDAEYWSSLKPDVLAIFHKLKAEGNDDATSQQYATQLVAWMTEGCTNLSQVGQTDFSQALVRASVIEGGHSDRLF